MFSEHRLVTLPQFLFWTGLFFNIWLLQMLWQHLANIAQEKSRASIEQKDRIVWNNDIVHAGSI